MSRNMCSLYGIGDEYANLMENKRKEIIASISELSPIKQQQILNYIDELLKITISACQN